MIKVKTASLQKRRKRTIFPLNIPILASIGVHAMLFTLIMPKWGMNNSTGDIQSLLNTPVIELNNIEQSRLPNLSSQNLSNWDLLSQLPSTNNQNPQIKPPNIDIDSFQFPLPTNNNLPKLPAPPSNISTPSYFYNIPAPSSQLPPPPPSNLNDFNTIANLPLEIQNQLIDVNSEEQNNMELRDKLFPLSGAKEEIPNPRDLFNGNKKPPKDIQNSQVAINSNNQTNNNNNPQQVAIKSPPVKPKNYAQLTSALQKNDNDTKPEETQKNYVGFVSKSKVVKPETVYITGIYPRDACIRRLKGTANYGVTVNSQGNVINTKLIKSAGYPIFNQQALRQIQGRNFGSNNQAYHVYVSFKPTGCPSLSLANLGKIPPKNQSNPMPKPVRETNPKPEPNQPQVKPNNNNNAVSSPVKPEGVNKPSNNNLEQNKPVETSTPISPIETSKPNPINNINPPRQVEKKTPVSPPVNETAKPNPINNINPPRQVEKKPPVSPPVNNTPKTTPINNINPPRQVEKKPPVSPPVNNTPKTTPISNINPPRQVEKKPPVSQPVNKTPKPLENPPPKPINQIEKTEPSPVENP